MRVVLPAADPRLAPFQLLQRLMPLEQARDDRRLLHRIDLKQAVTE